MDNNEDEVILSNTTEALIKKQMKKKLQEEQEQQELDQESLRIQTKRSDLETKKLEQEKVRSESVENIELFLLEMIGDINDMIKLGYKGRYGSNLSTKLLELNNKILQKRKEVAGKNIILNSIERNECLNFSKRLDMNIKNVVLPQSVKDRNKLERMKNSL